MHLVFIYFYFLLFPHWRGSLSATVMRTSILAHHMFSYLRKFLEFCFHAAGVWTLFNESAFLVISLHVGDITGKSDITLEKVLGEQRDRNLTKFHFFPPDFSLQGRLLHNVQVSNYNLTHRWWMNYSVIFTHYLKRAPVYLHSRSGVWHRSRARINSKRSTVTLRPWHHLTCEIFWLEQFLHMGDFLWQHLKHINEPELLRTGNVGVGNNNACYIAAPIIGLTQPVSCRCNPGVERHPLLTWWLKTVL